MTTTPGKHEATAVSAPAVALATARRMVALALGATLFSCLCVLSYGYALHSPRPHAVRVDVVASAPVVSGIRAAMDAAAPGGFDVRRVADAGIARRDVRTVDAAGALLLTAGGPAQVLTAGAGGVSLQTVVTGALTGAAHGRPVEQHDLVPLPAGDRSGQSGFVFEIGLLIPGVIGSLGFYLLGRRARLWVRVTAAAAYAVLASAAGVLVLDLGLGALTGSFWSLLATGALVAATDVLFVAALHTVLGLPGTGLAAIVLLVVGNAANGSTVAVPLLPDGYRQLALWLPNGAAVRAIRDDVYFDGHGQGQPMLALGLWVGAALLVMVAADLVQLRQRRHAPLQHQAIHATPLVQALRDHRRAHQLVI